MKIVYDNIIFSLQQAGGISTYWGELCQRFIRDEAEINFIEDPKSINQNLVRKSLSINSAQIRYQSYSSLKRFNLIKIPASNSPFIFHSSYNRITDNNKALKVTTIHDFVHEKYYTGLRKFLHTHQKSKAIITADKIITVSENTKTDLLKAFPNLAPSSISVIYNGVSEDFYQLSKKDPIAKPYLIFIGSREMYKNFLFAVKLVKELKQYDLYIVGKALTNAEQSLLLNSIPGSYKTFNFIDNQQLNLLYNNATALLYPSSYEGFGIPLLEAMKSGLPFIALNRSSIPEVSGNAGELADSLDIDCFKDLVQKIEMNREKYVKSGLEQAAKFSWEKCYHETNKLYQQLYS